jgi:tRNA threonylcarbamoyladenosine biosynthesis protein TsaB
LIVLGLDTCLASCSVAVLDGERVLAAAREVMARGHQERLAPMAQATLADAGLKAGALDRIGVTVGPGSFTGLRVGVAFAKGLAFALRRPAVGVGTLEALAAEARGLVFAAVDARRGQVYLQGFEAGRALMAPDALPVETAAARVAELSAGRPFTVVGSGAPLLADLGAAGLRPLYLRAPDARPAA